MRYLVCHWHRMKNSSRYLTIMHTSTNIKLMKKIYKYLIILVVSVIVILSTLYFLRSNVTEKQKETYASYISEGEKQLERKEYGKALTSFASASETIPSKRESYEKIVDLLVLKRKFDDAKDVVEQSTKVLSPSDRSSVMRRLARAYYESNQFDKAEKYLLTADQSQSSDEGFLWMGKVYLKLNDTTKAEKFLKKVKGTQGSVALEKDLLLGYLKKLDSSGVKDSLGKWDLSVEANKNLSNEVSSYLQVLNTLSKDELYNRVLLARQYINYGYPIVAIEILESEVEKMSEYPDGLYFLARAYFDSGKYSSALDILNRALGFNLYTDDIYLLMARANLINGDQNVAFDSYERAIESAGKEKQGEIYREFVEILLEEKSYSEVKKNLDLVVQNKVVSDLWPYFGYIEMYYNQKNYGKMSEVLGGIAKDSTLTDAEKMEYLKWQITFDIENDKLTSAKELLTTLRSLDRFNPHFHLLSGRVNLIENNQDKAKEDLNNAINYDLIGEVTESAKRLLGRIE